MVSNIALEVIRPRLQLASDFESKVTFIPPRESDSAIASTMPINNSVFRGCDSVKESLQNPFNNTVWEIHYQNYILPTEVSFGLLCDTLSSDDFPY